ncbi:MAG: parallel beta-helix repeat protein [Planctomycetota bacterium]
MRRARGFRYGLFGIVAITILPAMLLPLTFFSSLQEFWKINVELPPTAHRAIWVEDRVSYFMKRKWSTLGRVLTFNGLVDRIPVEDYWADDEIHVDIPSAHMDLLAQDLPISGEEYQKMDIWNNGRFRSARMRYRGNSGWHWLFDKKSLKIRTSKRRLFHGHRTLNFTVKMPYLSTVRHDLAQAFGLLAPDSTVVRVFVNNEYYGIERYMEEIDESFLRGKGRLPGDIYKGESVKATNEYHYGSKGEFLLRSPYIWPKIAVDNTLPEDDRQALVAWTRAVNDPAPEAQDTLEAFADLDTAARHLALNILLAEYHCRDGNNLKWYLDPTDGKFYPILWDIYSGKNAGLFKDDAPASLSIVNHATHKLLRDPRLMQRALRILHDELVEPGLIESVIDPLLEWAQEHEAAVAADRGKNYFSAGSETLPDCQAFLARNRKTALKYISTGRLYFKQSGRACVLGTDAAAGALVDAIQLEGDAPPSSFDLVLDLDRDGIEDQEEPRLRLEHQAGGLYSFPSPQQVFPGLSGPSRLITSILTYSFLLPDGFRVHTLTARNAVTGKSLKTDRRKRWTQPLIDAIHPWDRLEPEPSTWRWSAGERLIENDLTVPEHVTLVIDPGTKILLAPGVSVYVKGKVLALGSPEAPITFEAQEPGLPWGTFALQGSGSNGSRFIETTFRGGSLARHERVRYPGMVCVHHAQDVRFERCLFEGNLIGDDGLRAAHSEVDVIDCRFLSMASDALDFDQSMGRITGNHFLRPGNDGIDLMTSNPWIEGNILEGCGDKGISIGEAARPIVINNLIRDCEVGIQSKDWADPLILHCDIIGCRKGVDSYKKNWRYGEGGRGQLIHCRIIDNDVAASTDDRSRLIFQSCKIVGELDGQAERTFIRDCATTLDQEVGLYAPAFARFENDDLPSEIGYREGWSAKSRRVLSELRFQDGLAPSHQGWKLEGGKKIFVEGRALRAGLGRDDERLVHDSLANTAADSRRLHLSLSASVQTEVHVLYAGRELARVDLDGAPRWIVADLDEGESGRLELTTESRCTLRVHESLLTQASGTRD